MNHVNNIFGAFKEMVDKDPNGIAIPKVLVEKMLETNTRLSRESGRDAEREELVCRLLASGMPIEEISVVLKIRADEIRIIESNNRRIKIPDYVKKLKSRRISRERAAKQPPVKTPF